VRFGFTVVFRATVDLSVERVDSILQPEEGKGNMWTLCAAQSMWKLQLQAIKRQRLRMGRDNLRVPSHALNGHCGGVMISECLGEKTAPAIQQPVDRCLCAGVSGRPRFGKPERGRESNPHLIAVDRNLSGIPIAENPSNRMASSEDSQEIEAHEG
jgi:hypothetical protein